MESALLIAVSVLLQAGVVPPCGCCASEPVPVVQSSELGSVGGSVAFDGEPLQGAILSLSTASGTVVSVSGADGEFSFLNVQPGGPYKLTAELAGMKSRPKKRLSVEAGQETRVQFKMRLDPRTTVCIDCGNAEPRRIDGPGVIFTKDFIDLLPL